VTLKPKLSDKLTHNDDRIKEVSYTKFHQNLSQHSKEFYKGLLISPSKTTRKIVHIEPKSEWLYEI
jgi:hypothetical protein